jgi:anti-anti-sigma factor
MPLSPSGSSKESHDGVPFSIVSTTLGEGRRRLEIRGELDIATSPRLNAALLRELLSDHDVELDLSRVTFMDASALGTILGSRNRFERRKRSLSLSLRPKSQPHRLLKLTGILPVLIGLDETRRQPQR